MTRRHALEVAAAAGVCFGAAHAVGATVREAPPDPVASSVAPASRDRPVMALGPADRLPVLRPPPVARRKPTPARSAPAPRRTRVVARATSVRRAGRSVVPAEPVVRSVPTAPRTPTPPPVVAPPVTAAPTTSARPAPAAVVPVARARTEHALVFFDDGG